MAVMTVVVLKEWLTEPFPWHWFFNLIVVALFMAGMHAEPLLRDEWLRRKNRYRGFAISACVPYVGPGQRSCVRQSP